MAAFFRPRSLDEACALLAGTNRPAVHAGGTAIPLFAAHGLPAPDDLVDISGIAGLDELTVTADGLRLGALVTLRRLERDARVDAAAPLLAKAAAEVAHPRIRNVATIGGSIGFADPRLDTLPSLLVLDAGIQVSSASGARTIAAGEFFRGPHRTALAPGEIVTGILIPHQPAAAADAFVKHTSLSTADWPCASAAALAVPRTDRPVELRLGLGAVAATPVLVTIDLTVGTTADEAGEAAAAAAQPAIDPVPDVRGSAAYKRRLALIAVSDAARRAWRARQHAPSAGAGGASR